MTQLNRYEFLTALHKLVGTRTYLEIGVQTGASLQCAVSSPNIKTIIGVDPELGNLQYHPEGSVLVEETSDQFFETFAFADGKTQADSDIDVVFIDGLHHSDQVWKDLAHAVQLGHPKTLYVLDDVLPRNDMEASRDMIPGDWTGDVWKVLDPIGYFTDTDKHLFSLVDTFPTGIAVIGGVLDGVGMLDTIYHPIETQVNVPAEYLGTIPTLDSYFTTPAPVPQWILKREGAQTGDEALELIREWLAN